MGGRPSGMTNEAKPRRGTVQPENSISLTLKKGLSLLSLFDSDHPEWTFTELWKQAGLSRPTAFRLVRTLEEAGYLHLDAQKGTYHLGVAILRGIYLMLAPSELVRIAHPFMQQLEKETTETVILAVLVDDQAVLADRVLTSRPFKPDNPVGLAMPDLANVHTRIFMAYGPEKRRSETLSQTLTPRTAYTVTDPQLLAAELDKIRREGVAVGEQEWNIGMCAAGAPVFDAAGEVRASLAVVAPVERFGPGEKAALIKAVKRTAQEISLALGHRS
ncbi:MAG: IclR family transcriptional regulator [Actinobacteria bacterium]|nr:IclR family transcriptional regulator [Actinomycetota bacterium]